MAVSPKDRAKMIEMYQKKLSISEIQRQLHYAHVTIKKVLIEEGIFDPERRKTPKPPEKSVLGRPHEFYAKEKENTAIKKTDILQVRANTKIGDVFYIRTDKGDRSADEEDDSNRFASGALRKVTVVSTSNPRFCIVKLDSGVTEAVLWADIIKMKRKESNN